MTADVWLPIPADEIEGLPDPSDSGLSYRFWDGGPDFPADPADCAFYAVPYMKGMEIAVRPLAAMTSVRVVQTLSAGIDHVEPGLGALRSGVRLCNAKGVHEASTAELTLALILASLRGLPGFVRGQDKEEWRAGFYPALADKSVLIVGYGSIGAAIEDRLAPFECARVARVARSARTTERGEVRALADLPALLPEADIVILSTPLTEQTKGLANSRLPGPDEGRCAAGQRRARPGCRHQGAARRGGARTHHRRAGCHRPGAAARGAPPVARPRCAHQPPCGWLHLGVHAARQAAARRTTHAIRRGRAGSQRGVHDRIAARPVHFGHSVKSPECAACRP